MVTSKSDWPAPRYNALEHTSSYASAGRRKPHALNRRFIFPINGTVPPCRLLSTKNPPTLDRATLTFSNNLLAALCPYRPLQD